MSSEAASMGDFGVCVFSRFGVQGLGFRVSGSGFRVQGLGAPLHASIPVSGGMEVIRLPNGLYMDS